jgi:predicted ATPase
LKLYLRDKHQLLVLDNFEQVVAAAPMLAELLAAAPAVKMLVTSRAALHLYEEHQIVVRSLAVPDMQQGLSREQLAEYGAVQLFQARTQAVKADWTLTDANANAVAEICARLDGLPLAIELAAARCNLFTPEALLARLRSRLDLLTGGPLDQPARHQTLRSAIAWSYDLLDPQQRIMFRRLAVFAGGCSIGAAEVVCSVDDDPAPALLDRLAALLDHSLIQQEERGEEPRILMLETIREYASEQLELSGEADVVRQRHAHFFLGLAGENGVEIAGLETDHDNMLAALDWALADQASDLRVCEQLALAGAPCLRCIRSFRSHLPSWRTGRLARSGPLPVVERPDTRRAPHLAAQSRLRRAFGDALRSGAGAP